MLTAIIIGVALFICIAARDRPDLPIIHQKQSYENIKFEN